MGMYLVAPPVLFVFVALFAGIVIAIASRLVRRADWLEERAAAEAAEPEDGAATE